VATTTASGRSAITVAASAWMFQRERVTAPAQQQQPVAQQIAQAAVLPVAQNAPAVEQQGRLAVNAFPWATITNIRNLESGDTIETNLVTPAPVELAPGRYEVTLTHPEHARAIVRTVTIEPDRDTALNVQFADADSLPDFGGGGTR